MKTKFIIVGMLLLLFCGCESSKHEGQIYACVDSYEVVVPSGAFGRVYKTDKVCERYDWVDKEEKGE